jgi:hypothetical protein
MVRYNSCCIKIRRHSDYTEIAVHGNVNRVASLMHYEGGTTNEVTLARDMGWGALSSVIINGNTSNPNC